MTRTPTRQPGRTGRRAAAPAGVANIGGILDQAAKVDTAPAVPDLDERLARELVKGLVRSAVARGADPIARVQEFRTLQQAAIAKVQDAVIMQIAERLVRAADLTLQELLTAKS